MAILLK